MISTKLLYERLGILTKSGTSGYFTQEDFNSNLYSVTYAILATLCDNYEKNQKVTDYLVNHITLYSSTTEANGFLFDSSITETLEDYYRTLSVHYKGSTQTYSSQKSTIGELGMYLSSPIRRPNKTKGQTIYCFVDGNIKMYPNEATDFDLYYCRKPVVGELVLEDVSDEENDYTVVDEVNTVDIDFPEGLFNLFVYFMLESMGIEQKENLAMEFSQLGIERTVITDIK